MPHRVNVEQNGSQQDQERLAFRTLLGSGGPPLQGLVWAIRSRDSQLVIVL